MKEEAECRSITLYVKAPYMQSYSHSFRRHLENILRKLLPQLLCSSFNCLATASACIHFAPRVYEGSQ